MRAGGNFWRWWMCLWHRLQYWLRGCMLISKLIKLYTLCVYMHSFLYVNHMTTVVKNKRRETDLCAQAEEHVRTQQEGSFLQARKRALTRIWPFWHPNPRLPDSRTVRNINVCCLKHLVHGILLWYNLATDDSSLAPLVKIPPWTTAPSALVTNVKQ